MGVSVYWSLCVLCVFACICVISNQNTSKKPQVLDPSELDAFSHKTHSNVLVELRYQGLTCDLLCKITHQMWRHHSFIQKNKETKREMGVEVGRLEKI